MGASNTKQSSSSAQGGTSLTDLPDDVLRILFWNAVSQVPGQRRFTFASLCNTCNPWRTKIMAHIEHWSRERLGPQVQTSLNLMQLPPALKTLDFSHVKFTPQNAGVFVSLLQKHAATLEKLIIHCANVNQSDLVAWIPQLPKLQHLEFTVAHPTRSLYKAVGHIPNLQFAISNYFERLSPEHARREDFGALERVTNLSREQLFPKWNIGFNHGSRVSDSMMVGDLNNNLEKYMVDVLPRAAQLERFTLRATNPSKFTAPAIEQLLPSFRYLVNLEISCSSFNMHNNAIFAALATIPPLPYLDEVILREYHWTDILNIFCNPDFFPSMLSIVSGWDRNENMHEKTAKLKNKKIGGGTKNVSVKLTGTVLFDKEDGSHNYYLVDHPGFKNWVILSPNYRFG